jgi:integrase
LLAEKQKQDEYKKLFGNTYKDSGYVFTHPDGTPLRPDCLTRTFKRVLKAHGFKEDIRFHDLRHTCASYLLINQHWDMKRIQEWLGHSRIETTANIYTHIKKENAPICTNGLEGAFKF